MYFILNDIESFVYQDTNKPFLLDKLTLFPHPSKCLAQFNAPLRPERHGNCLDEDGMADL
jgi:hypothetical protein